MRPAPAGWSFSSNQLTSCSDQAVASRRSSLRQTCAVTANSKRSSHSCPAEAKAAAIAAAAVAATTDDRDSGPQEKQRGELQENVVKIKRCAAVVKGGRRFSFAAMVVVGNGNGKVGWGYGKANEVPPSVEKAVKEGMRSQIEVARDGDTIPHLVKGRYGAAKVVLVPAAPGTGVIAGAAVRAVCEAAGIHDILTKSFGSNNPVSLVKATMAALQAAAAEDRRRAAARSHLS